MHPTSVKVHPSASKPKFVIYVRMFIGRSSAIRKKIKMQRWSYGPFFSFNL